MKGDYRYMKRVTVGLLSLLFPAIVFLNGCGDAAVSSPDSSAPLTVSPTASVSLEDLPGPVTGTFQGQTITMSYAAISDLTIDLEFSKPFHNGYAVVMTTHSELSGPAYQETFAFIDTQGRVLGNTFYLAAMPFGKEGLATVKKTDGTWATIDQTGNEVSAASEPVIPAVEQPFYNEGDLYGLLNSDGQPITPLIYASVGLSFQEGLCFVRLSQGENRNVLIDSTGQICTTLPDDCISAQANTDNTVVVWYSTGLPYAQYRLFNTQGELLNELYFDKIGNFVEGLAPVVRNGLMGVIDNQGNLIIEPSLPIENYYRADLCLSENYILGQIHENQLAILQVTRS